MPEEIFRLEVITEKKDVLKWTSFLNTYRIGVLNGALPKVLYVDFSKCDFVKPYHIVSLACLIEEYFINGVEIRFTKGNKESTNYLEEIAYFKYWNKGFDRSQFGVSNLKSALSLWKLHKEKFHAYVMYAQKYFQDNYFNGRDLQPLNTALAETFNNVLDHSKSTIGGYVFTQYYPADKQIIIALCDFGTGIPQTVNNYLVDNNKEALPNDEALMLAFTRGFSTKSTPNNKGFGLDNISSLVKSLKSEFLLVSNNVYLKQLSEGNFVKHIMEVMFPGTLFVITLNTDNLNPLEEEELAKEDFYF